MKSREGMDIAMIATAPRRLNVGFPAFARAIFHAPIILDHIAH
jgi:hypothetical protein